MSDAPQVSFAPSPSEPAKPYQHQDFPKMVFRDDDHLVVADEDELTAALADGWKTRDQLNNLDLDEDGAPGGSKPAGAKPRSKPGKEA